MTHTEASSVLLILVLQSSPQAPLLDWIMQNQPEDLALMEVGEDGILQIRELPSDWGWTIPKKVKEGLRLYPGYQYPIRSVFPSAWNYLWLLGKTP